MPLSSARFGIRLKYPPIALTNPMRPRIVMNARPRFSSVLMEDSNPILHLRCYRLAILLLRDVIHDGNGDRGRRGTSMTIADGVGEAGRAQEFLIR